MIQDIEMKMTADTNPLPVYLSVLIIVFILYVTVHADWRAVSSVSVWKCTAESCYIILLDLRYVSHRLPLSSVHVDSFLKKRHHTHHMWVQELTHKCIFE